MRVSNLLTNFSFLEIILTFMSETKPTQIIYQSLVHTKSKMHSSFLQHRVVWKGNPQRVANIQLASGFHNSRHVIFKLTLFDWSHTHTHTLTIILSMLLTERESSLPQIIPLQQMTNGPQPDVVVYLSQLAPNLCRQQTDKLDHAIT